MKNYLKRVNQRIGNIFVNIRTLEELERKMKKLVDEEENIFEYNQNIKKVWNFIKKGEFEEAKNILEKLKKLHRMGYYELGKYYYFCEEDTSKAENNLYIAFENGVVKAGYYLGLLEEESNINLSRNWYVTSFNFSEKSVMKLFYFAIREENFWAIDGYFYYLLQYGKNAINLYEFAKYYFWRNDFEKIKEIQEKLTSKSQILYLTKEILHNVKCMLGNEKEREYVKFVENAKNLEKLGEIEKAEEFYKKSVEYSKYGYFSLIEFYADNADVDEIEKIHETVSFEDIKAEATYQLGKYEEDYGNTKLAVEKYLKAMKKGHYKAAYQIWKLENKSYLNKINSKINSFKYLKDSANLGYGLAMIEMALDSQLDSLKSFEMSEKILTQNNIFELTKEIVNEAKMIYFGNEIKEIMEIDYEEQNINVIKMMFGNEKKRKDNQIGKNEYLLIKNNLQRDLEIIGEKSKTVKQTKKSSNLFKKLKMFFRKT